MPRAGAYRDRATFERRATVVDDLGNSRGNWQTLWRGVAVSFYATGGAEAVRSGAVSSSITATLRLRDSTRARTIRTSDRVTVRGQAWNIRRIIPLNNMNRELEMLIESGVAT